MKEIIILGGAAILGVGFWMHNPIGATNVYNMPVEEAYKRLAAVEVEPSGTGPFGRLETVTSGTSPKSVKWTASGSHARVECTAIIESRGETATWLNVSCDGGGASNGAANGMFLNLIRNRVIELVDSTLDGRSYDPAKAQGSSAFGWPEDPIPHGGLREATGKALEMQAETERMIRDAERNAR